MADKSFKCSICGKTFTAKDEAALVKVVKEHLTEHGKNVTEAQAKEMIAMAGKMG